MLAGPWKLNILFWFPRFLTMRPTSHSQMNEPASSGDDARERIVSAARRHFLAHGFRGVTMDDLAAELGMSKKTLYAHFASKRELLAAVIDSKLRAADRDLDRVASESASDFLAGLHQLLACMRKHSEE